MTASNLLLWMSARGSGSWQQFRTAVEELHLEQAGGSDDGEEPSIDRPGLPLHQHMRFNLQRMGHAEFFAGAGEHEWRVTPPVLAMGERFDSGNSFGVLCGARSSALLNRLQLAARDHGCELERAVRPDYPDLLFVAGGVPSVIAAVARDAGLTAQPQAATAILICLPVIADPAVRRPAQIPLGNDWIIHEFSPQTLRWQEAQRFDAQASTGGLFRFVLQNRAYRRHTLLCAKGAANEVSAAVGKYIVLKRRGQRVLRYDRPQLTLSVPASCGLPFLIERALVLCSGEPPTRNTSTGAFEYRNVPDNVARLTASILRQELA